MELCYKDKIKSVGIKKSTWYFNKNKVNKNALLLFIAPDIPKWSEKLECQGNSSI